MLCSRRKTGCSFRQSFIENSCFGNNERDFFLPSGKQIDQSLFVFQYEQFGILKRYYRPSFIILLYIIIIYSRVGCIFNSNAAWGIRQINVVVANSILNNKIILSFVFCFNGKYNVRGTMDSTQILRLIIQSKYMLITSGTVYKQVKSDFILFFLETLTRYDSCLYLFSHYDFSYTHFPQTVG